MCHNISLLAKLTKDNYSEKQKDKLELEKEKQKKKSMYNWNCFILFFLQRYYSFEIFNQPLFDRNCLVLKKDNSK